MAQWDFMKLTNNMCELIGAIIGNGNIYDRRPSYVELSGHPTEDLIYFKKILTQLVINELSYNPRLFFHSSAVRIRISNKNFVIWLKSLGIPSGKFKFKRVLIPKKICISWKKTRNCIRGIFDTDGCVSFDKRPIYSQPYPRVVLHILNEDLLKQLYKILKDKKFNVTISKKESSIYLNGFNEVRKFLIRIGFSNPRHHNRIKSLYPNLMKYNSVKCPSSTAW